MVYKLPSAGSFHNWEAIYKSYVKNAISSRAGEIKYMILPAEKREHSQEPLATPMENSKVSKITRLSAAPMMYLQNPASWDTYKAPVIQKKE